MQIHAQKVVPRLIRLLVTAIVIGITWYIYEDYVKTTSAQDISAQKIPAENRVIQQTDKSVVQGVIEIVPKPRGVLIVPAE